MNILMIGDVVAKPGRLAVLERIQDLREQYRIELAVMNAENLAGGFSVTPSLCEQLFNAGIDVMTSGNHIFDKKEAIPYIGKQPRLLRPANYPPNTPGNGMWTGVINQTPVAVINSSPRTSAGISTLAVTGRISPASSRNNSLAARAPVSRTPRRLPRAGRRDNAS